MMLWPMDGQMAQTSLGWQFEPHCPQLVSRVAVWATLPPTIFHGGQKWARMPHWPHLASTTANNVNFNLGPHAGHGFGHHQKGHLGPHGPQLVSGTMVCEDMRTGAGADTVQTRWIARWGGGGMATPRSRSLIDACSITAMHQDQTRYGAATLTVGPRAHMPGHRTSFLILNSRVCTEPDTVGKLAPWGSLRQLSTNFIMGCTEPEAVGKFAQWGSPRRQSANLITGCTEPEAVDKLAPWGSRGCRQIS